jgi:hypothetical protein
MFSKAGNNAPVERRLRAMRLAALRFVAVIVCLLLGACLYRLRGVSTEIDVEKTRLNRPRRGPLNAPNRKQPDCNSFLNFNCRKAPKTRRT